MTCSLRAGLVACAVVLSHAAAQPRATASAAAPRTRAESSAWLETSRNADVDAFLAALRSMPHGGRLAFETFGRTVQGRPLQAVHVKTAGAPEPRLRALVVANIHGGEVEGKEAVQVLLREMAAGDHAELLAQVDVTFVPVFNADGNDEIDPANRVEQNGPARGVGRRHNSQDRDLNRDFVKLESPEARALLRLFAAVDPHLFMDLHTTNGSHHGYHLTYCTSLNGNVDPDLAELMHDRFLPGVRARMLEAHGRRVFDYGNFGRGGPESGWTTFSADPRLAINYAGLRHCLSVLSEAYSYLPFAERAAVTRAFVLENLAELAARRDEVLELRAVAVERAPTLPLAFAHELAPPVQGELLVGAVEEMQVEGLGKRYAAKPEFHAVEAPLRLRFVAKQQQALPAAWAFPGDLALVAQVVRAHGVQVVRLNEAVTVDVERFDPTQVTRAARPFQGHRLVSLQGGFATQRRTLPAGTFVVRADHPLARLAALLLEARSDDGLATWGYFDEHLATDAAGTERLGYPVVRLHALPALRASEVAANEPAFPRLVPYDVADEPPALVLAIAVVAEGARVPPRGFESEVRFTGRELRYTLGGDAVASLAVLPQALAERRAAGDEIAEVGITRGDGVTHRELVQACESVRGAGVGRVVLVRAR